MLIPEIHVTKMPIVCCATDFRDCDQQSCAQRRSSLYVQPQSEFLRVRYRSHGSQPRAPQCSQVQWLDNERLVPKLVEKHLAPTLLNTGAPRFGLVSDTNVWGKAVTDRIGDLWALGNARCVQVPARRAQKHHLSLRLEHHPHQLAHSSHEITPSPPHPEINH